MEGHKFQNIEIKDSTVVLGNIQSRGGVIINSKTATSAVVGQTQKSLRPVAFYVARPVLHQGLKRRLHDTLNDRGVATKIVVVCGLGGAGKSQLALSYIQAHRTDYSAVFWIEAGSTTTLERDYVQIWRMLSQSTQEKISLDEAVRGTKAWLHDQDKEKKWLLVFDSADSIDDEKEMDYIDLNTFIPDASCVDVIVTTRSQTAKELTEIEEIQVGDLDEDEALELLLRCSKIKDATESQKREAALIVKELGYFALAVAIAGAYIAATPRIRYCLETYLPEYRKQRKTILGRKARQQVHQYGASVLTTWETSQAAVAKQCPEALGLLSLITFLSPDDIFHELFAPLIDKCLKSATIWSSIRETTCTDDVITKMTLDAAFEVLERYSLLSWKDEQASFAMHKLVHTWGYDRMTLEEQGHRCQEAIATVSHLLKWKEHNPAMRARLLPHLMSSFLRLQECDAVTSRLQEETLMSLENYSEFLRDNGHYIQGIEVCRFRCKAEIRLCGTDEHGAVMAAEQWLATMLWHQGQWADAERLETNVLEKRQKLLGEEDPDTLVSMADLASTYRSQGRWDDAEKLEVKVLATNERVHGAEHAYTLTSMANLASTYRSQGRCVDAEMLELKVLATTERLFGAEHPATLSSMANLASTLWSQGRWTDAEELEVKVLAMSKRTFGPEHPVTLTNMANLALSFWSQGRWADAAELHMKVLEARKRVLGPLHPDTLTSVANLASAYRNQGRCADAEKLYEQAIEMNSRILGHEHPNTLGNMDNLALTYKIQGRLIEAKTLQIQILKTSSNVLGAEHPDTLTIMHHLALTYYEQRMLQPQPTRQRPVRQQTARQRMLQQRTLRQQNLQQAHQLMARCVEARVKKLGSPNPDTKESLLWLEKIRSAVKHQSIKKRHDRTVRS